MKYEFRSMFRLFIPMWLGLLILSVVNRFTTNLQFGNDKLLNFFVGLALFLYVVGIIAVIIVAYIFIVLRFYKGLLKDEGYLTMTLPVSLDSILWGKALAAWILMVLTTLVCLVSAGILLLANVNLRDLAAVWEQTVTYFGSVQTALLTVQVILTALLSTLYGILLPYLAMAIGHLAQKHRVGASVLAYVVMATVLSTVYNTFLTPALLNFLVGYQIPVLSPEALAGMISRGLWIYLLVILVSCVIFYIPTRVILSKKLNLE